MSNKLVEELKKEDRTTWALVYVHHLLNLKKLSFLFFIFFYTY